MSDNTTVSLNYFVILSDDSYLLDPDVKPRATFSPPEFEQWLASCDGWSIGFVKDSAVSVSGFAHYDVDIKYKTVRDAVLHKLRWSGTKIRAIRIEKDRWW